MALLTRYVLPLMLSLSVSLAFSPVAPTLRSSPASHGAVGGLCTESRLLAGGRQPRSSQAPLSVLKMGFLDVLKEVSCAYLRACCFCT